MKNKSTKQNPNPECLNCSLLKSTCEAEDGDKWVKNCMNKEGKKHVFVPENAQGTGDLGRVPTKENWETLREELREEFEELFPKDQEAIDGIRPSKSNRSAALVLWGQWERILKLALESQEQELIEKVRKTVTKREQVNGYQPHVPENILSDAMQRKIFFDGWEEGRALMRIDLNSLFSTLQLKDNKENK